MAVFLEIVIICSIWVPSSLPMGVQTQRYHGNLVPPELTSISCSGCGVMPMFRRRIRWGTSGRTFCLNYGTAFQQYGWLHPSADGSMVLSPAACEEIVRIPAAYVSRISNATVYEKAGMKPFSQQILKHQLQLLRKVAIQSHDHPLRVDTFEGATLNPQIGRYVRRVGRPRQDWTTQLLHEGRERVGVQRFDRLISDRSDGADVRWKVELDKCF